MANAQYPLGLKALADGDIDLLSNTISMQLYSGAVAYDPADQYLSDVPGTKQGSPVTLTGKATTGGKFTATVPAFTPPASTILAIILYVNSGSDATSRLLAFINERADGTPLSLVVDGTTFSFNWNEPIFSIGGL